MSSNSRYSTFKYCKYAPVIGICGEIFLCAVHILASFSSCSTFTGYSMLSFVNDTVCFLPGALRRRFIQRGPIPCAHSLLRDNSVLCFEAYRDYLEILSFFSFVREPTQMLISHSSVQQAPVFQQWTLFE